MPEITVTKQVEVEIEAEFEAFCARCNAGMCGNVDTRVSRNRGYPQITIEPCERCEQILRAECADEADKRVEEARRENDDEIERLKARIDELEQYEPV